MQKQIKTSMLTVAALFVIAGCQSATDSDASYDAESYEYKGAADPLLSVSAAERAGPLSDRFDLVQGRQ